LRGRRARSKIELDPPARAGRTVLEMTMHTHSLERWQHGHVFLGAAHQRNERRVQLVIGLTLLMMVGEVVAGSVFGSMALLADGWHMATHAGALSISALAYAFARRRANDARYVFGTGKVGDLAGFTSAVVLAGIACLIGFQSFGRLLQPAAIRFDEAILVALLGLVVNLVSAGLLSQGGAHPHAHGEHDHPEGHDGHLHQDHNLRSAHLHVLADALTSVFAIAALCTGKFLGWAWTDALCGVVGALVILRWSIGLLRDSGAVLLDVEPDPALAQGIRQRIEAGGEDRIADLHVWRIGPGNFAAILSIVSQEPRPPADYKAQLSEIPGLSHVTVEVQACAGCPA
jgi:cation diffusion facilitator family transporter